MKIRYREKEIELIECKTFYTRLKGFMGKKNIHNALLFNHFNSVHTFFMKENIDIIFCNKENKIISYYQNTSPRKVILPQRKATKTIELPANYFKIKIGERLEIIK